MSTVTVLSEGGAGLRMQVDLRDEKFYLTGTYEREVQHCLAEHLGRGATFWDIGAHAGFFAILAARLVGSTGSVHAFEPSPANRLRIQCAADLNGFENLVVHGCAVSAHAGVATIQEGGHGPGSSFTWTLQSGDMPVAAGPQVKVDVTTLDQLAKELGSPDVIKIDVEGAEIGVLRGGKNLLNSSEPRPTVLCEFHNVRLLEEARDLMSGHSFRKLDTNHWLIT